MVGKKYRVSNSTGHRHLAGPVHTATCPELGLWKLWLGAALALLCLPSLAAEDGAHPHHLAGTLGAGHHNGKNSEFWGADYAYTFSNDVYLAGFYEQVRGEFNIGAWGVQVGQRFDNGWRVAIGPGVETKLKTGKNLLLVRATVGYDWHRGNWSYGPILSYDAIEDVSNTVYLGLAVGYGF